MEQLISKYETVFIINPDFNEENTKALVEKFSELITQNGGTIESVNEWGKRKLAYPIQNYTEGYYVLINFSSPTALPAELDRIYTITDGILRSLIVNIEK